MSLYGSVLVSISVHFYPSLIADAVKLDDVVFVSLAMKRNVYGVLSRYLGGITRIKCETPKSPITNDNLYSVAIE